MIECRNNIEKSNRFKIANFIVDEKFIDSLIQLYDEEFNFCHHDYILVSNELEPAFRYIRFKERILIIKPNDLLRFIAKENYDALFIHYLVSFPINLLPLIPKGIKVFWFAWGADIYEMPFRHPFININLFAPLTKRWIDKNYVKKYCEFKYLVKLFLKGRLSEIAPQQYYTAIQRVDYFSGVLDYEYDLMKDVPNFRAKKTRHQYSSSNLWESLSQPCPRNIGKNIFIGNSAAFTNNHLDILNKLSQLRIERRKVILPLSYCDYYGYAADVCAAYKNILGDDFIPIIDFMPIDQYLDLYNKCGFAIYGQERQAAIGNIIYALRSGIKVFMSETNLAYRYFKDLGMYIYSIQEDLSQESIDKNLSKEEINTNFQIINSLYNRDAYKRCVNDLLRCLQETF
jgi:hypothetical protein